MEDKPKKTYYVRTRPDIKMDMRRRHDRKVFATELVKHNLNPRDTMKALDPHLEPVALSNKVVRWMKNPEVIKEVSRAYEDLDLSTKDVKNYLSAILFKTISKDNTKDSDVIAGSLALGKVSGVISAESSTNILIDTSGKLNSILSRYATPTTEQVIEVNEEAKS